MTSDTLNILEDSEDSSPHTQEPEAVWKLLVVDDEEEVHQVTTLALDGIRFLGRKLQFLHARSGAEAIQMMEDTKDVAVMLLDVVMETDHAGLDVVRHVRGELGNRFVRIILRTGQPGQAPEHEVITQYDINDYKQKTELTREKLFTVVHTSISSYRDLIALDANRRGLRKVIEASARIFVLRSMEEFAQGVLEQLAALLYIDRDALVLHSGGLAAERQGRAIQILAGIGHFSEYVGRNADEVLDKETLRRVQDAIQAQHGHFDTDYLAAFYETPSGERNVLYIDGSASLPSPDRDLIELFCRNVAIAQDNIRAMEGNKNQ